MRGYLVVALLLAATPVVSTPGGATPVAANPPSVLPATVIADLRSEPDAAPVTEPAGTGPWDDMKLVPGETAPPFGVWDYAAVDPASGDLFIARMTGVERFARRQQVYQPSRFATGHHVHAVMTLPGSRVLFTNGDNDTVAVVDKRTGHSIGTLATGSKPDGALYDPDLRQALIMDGGDGVVDRIDTGPHLPRHVGHIQIGGKLEAAALGADDRLFVNIEDRNAMAIVSLRGDGRLVSQIHLTNCEEPSGLASDRHSGLLVSACANGVAKVLDQTGRDIATLPIGAKPDAVISDQARSRVFIPCGGNGSLDEIALDGIPRVTRIWETRRGARTGAFDPRTERVYLPYGDVVRQGKEPPELTPGTFGVLVVDVH